MMRSKLQQLQWRTFLLLILQLFPLSFGDIGTASIYNSPYIPTACYGKDVSQFPSTDLFVAAGEGIWDNGASCGRQYLVRCISATVPGICIPDVMVQVTVVDRAQTMVSTSSKGGTTMVLSNTAFETIANPSASINIEFQQV